jgi:hypothetical protein
MSTHHHRRHCGHWHALLAFDIAHDASHQHAADELETIAIAGHRLDRRRR